MQTTQRSHHLGAGAQWAKRHFQRTGFTLLELAIMMAALVVLITMVVTTFTQVQMHGRDKKRYGDISILHHELEDYYNTHGEYPGGCPDTQAPAVSPSCWLTTTTDIVLPSIDASTSLGNIRAVLPGIPDGWGDPNTPGNADSSPVTSPDDLKPLLSRDLTQLPRRYLYIGATAAGNISLARLSYTSLPCTFVTAASADSPTNYLIGYYSETKKKWVLLHGQHGEKWQIQGCTDGVEYVLDEL